MEILQNIKNKWLLWTGEHDVPDPIPDFEREQILEMEETGKQLLAQQQQILNLMQTPGWKLLEDHRRARIEVLRSQLERHSVEDEQAKDLRAELRVLRSYEHFLLSKLDFEIPENFQLR